MLDGPTVRVLKADDLAGRPLGVFGAPNLTIAAAVAIGGRATTVAVRYERSGRVELWNYKALQPLWAVDLEGGRVAGQAVGLVAHTGFRRTH